MKDDPYLYRRIAAKALGRPLPRKAVVHHVDGNRNNNEPCNLVICPDQTYHLLLHARARVVDAGGNPNTQKVCKVCRLVLDKDKFSFEKSWDGRAAACRECTNALRRGKSYSQWTERRAEQQRQRRASKC